MSRPAIKTDLLNEVGQFNETYYRNAFRACGQDSMWERPFALLPIDSVISVLTGRAGRRGANVQGIADVIAALTALRVTATKEAPHYIWVRQFNTQTNLWGIIRATGVRGAYPYDCPRRDESPDAVVYVADGGGWFTDVETDGWFMNRRVPSLDGKAVLPSTAGAY